MGKPKSSVVWAFFTQEEIEESGATVCVNSCKLCSYKQSVPNRSNANTSNLLKHVTSLHNSAFAAEKSRRLQEPSEPVAQRKIFTFAVSQSKPGSSKSASSSKSAYLDSGG